jgi:hypothetical protein
MQLRGIGQALPGSTKGKHSVHKHAADAQFVDFY